MATWKNFVRRGKVTRLADIASHTFLDIAAEKDKTIGELTFDPELTDTPWTKEGKNSTTFTNESKNTATWTNLTKN